MVCAVGARRRGEAYREDLVGGLQVRKCCAPVEALDPLLQAVVSARLVEVVEAADKHFCTYRTWCGSASLKANSS